MKILTLNLDYSNRHDSINTFESLSKFVVDYYWKFEPCVIVLSETRISFIKDYLSISLPHFSFIVEKIGYDALSIGFDKTKYQLLKYNDGLDHYYSKSGKYISCLLEDIKTFHQYLVVGVHHPYKSKKLKEEAVKYTLKNIESIEKTQGFDSVVVPGDFNEGVPQTTLNFSELNLSIGQNEYTTPNKTTPDNILYSNSLSLKGKKIISNSVLTHHPIFSTHSIIDNQHSDDNTNDDTDEDVVHDTPTKLKNGANSDYSDDSDSDSGSDYYYKNTRGRLLLSGIYDKNAKLDLDNESSSSSPSPKIKTKLSKQPKKQQKKQQKDDTDSDTNTSDEVQDGADVKIKKLTKELKKLKELKRLKQKKLQQHIESSSSSSSSESDDDDDISNKSIKTRSTAKLSSSKPLPSKVIKDQNKSKDIIKKKQIKEPSSSSSSSSSSSDESDEKNTRYLRSGKKIPFLKVDSKQQKKEDTNKNKKDSNKEIKKNKDIKKKK